MNWILIVLLFNGAGSGATGATSIGPYASSADCERAAVFIKSREHYCVPVGASRGSSGNPMELPEEFD